jgi:hypothetical protein
MDADVVRARRLGILDREPWLSDLDELPDGSVQLYVRDPAGNLIEGDWPGATTWGTSSASFLISPTTEVSSEGVRDAPRKEALRFKSARRSQGTTRRRRAIGPRTPSLPRHRRAG